MNNKINLTADKVYRFRKGFKRFSAFLTLSAVKNTSPTKGGSLGYYYI